MSRARSIRVALLATVLLASSVIAFIAIEVNATSSDEPAVNSANVQRIGGGSTLPTLSWVVAKFKDGYYGAFFKKCHLCTEQFIQAGTLWRDGFEPPAPRCFEDQGLRVCINGRVEKTVTWFAPASGPPINAYDVDYKYTTGVTWGAFYDGGEACVPTTPSLNATLEVRVIGITDVGQTRQCYVQMPGATCSGGDPF